MTENVVANTATEHLAGLVRLARQMNPDELRRFFVDCILGIPLGDLQKLEANIDNFRADLSERWNILIEQI